MSPGIGKFEPSRVTRIHVLLKGDHVFHPLYADHEKVPIGYPESLAY